MSSADKEFKFVDVKRMAVSRAGKNHYGSELLAVSFVYPISNIRNYVDKLFDFKGYGFLNKMYQTGQCELTLELNPCYTQKEENVESIINFINRRQQIYLEESKEVMDGIFEMLYPGEVNNQLFSNELDFQ